MATDSSDTVFMGKTVSTFSWLFLQETRTCTKCYYSKNIDDFTCWLSGERLFPFGPLLGGSFLLKHNGVSCFQNADEAIQTPLLLFSKEAHHPNVDKAKEKSGSNCMGELA